MPKVSPTDVIVIGAGPVGLWTVFELGLLGIRCAVIDTLNAPGGQCAALYGDKPIYDIPGLPVVTGEGLTQALMQQIKPFEPQFHWQAHVTELRQADGFWDLSTQKIGHTNGQRLRARCVVIAAGVGAFLPKFPALDGVNSLLGTDIFFEAPPADRRRGARRVVVLGGEQQAVDCALALSAKGAAGEVTLVHRRDVFRADAVTLEQLELARSSGRIHCMVGQPSQLRMSGNSMPKLTGIDLDTPHEGIVPIYADLLVIAQGLSPKLGPLSQWGLQMSRKLLVVDAATCATNEPGIFAVGDVVDYPGKKKLIVSGFHEATQAAFAVTAMLRPEDAGPLQYTTSSTLLQKRLGLA